MKAICEILVLALIGQGVLWVIARKSRESNLVYRTFAAVTRPVMRLSRVIAPRFIRDRHIWMVAVFIVFLAWIVSGQQKLKHCVTVSPDSPLCIQVDRALKERGPQTN